jgi:hypothetical protein
MKVGKGIGAKAMSGPGFASGLRANDARNTACPECGVKRVAHCVNKNGSRRGSTHAARRQAWRLERAR